LKNSNVLIIRRFHQHVLLAVLHSVRIVIILITHAVCQPIIIYCYHIVWRIYNNKKRCLLQVPFEVLESLSTNKTLFNLILENYPNLLLCRSSSVSQVNNASSGKDSSDIRTVNNKVGGLRSDTPPLVMKMKLKQSKKSNSMGSDGMSPLESQAISPPQTYTADNSPDRQPKTHPSMLKRQFSTTQSSYLKSLPYHRLVVRSIIAFKLFDRIIIWLIIKNNNIIIIHNIYTVLAIYIINNFNKI